MKYLALLLVPSLAVAQFKNDNVLYKTIYWDQFCKQFPAEKDALLLDVRSQGEYADTSENSGLNIGHLKGATHINITELGNRLPEITAYKNKPVYLYCSHSQRSRRCSKLLTDSGFTNVININGGLTDLYLTDQSTIPCKNGMLQTNNAYSQLNPKQVYDFIKSNPGITIIDVRKDSAFNDTSIVEKDKALGKLKGSVNIPLSQLESSLNKIPINKPILVIDAYGDEAAKAATLLAAKGYKNVITSFNGLDAWLQISSNQKNISYQILDAEAFNTMAATSNTIILDVRPEEEYQNQSKEAWRNRGRIKGSLNIPAKDLAVKYNTLDKNKSIILTGFGNSPEAYEAAAFLNTKGFPHVYVLTTGVWGLRYKAFNMPNSMYLNDWVVDVPEANK